MHAWELEIGGDGRDWKNPAETDTWTVWGFRILNAAIKREALSVAASRLEFNRLQVDTRDKLFSLEHTL
jgi:hypothetical protein